MCQQEMTADMKSFQTERTPNPFRVIGKLTKSPQKKYLKEPKHDYNHKEYNVMKKSVYPVVFSPAKEGGYDVYVPDFPLNTQGLDMADAIYMARSAIEAMGVYYQDEKKPVPAPSPVESIKASGNKIVSLVDVDFDAYRKSRDNRTVRRNVTLPGWLDDQASKAGINVSGVLQKALKQELNIS
jgi:predicted RNase H-like HicB family nuclease